MILVVRRRLRCRLDRCFWHLAGKEFCYVAPEEQQTALPTIAPTTTKQYTTHHDFYEKPGTTYTESGVGDNASDQRSVGRPWYTKTVNVCILRKAW